MSRAQHDTGVKVRRNHVYELFFHLIVEHVGRHLICVAQGTNEEALPGEEDGGNVRHNTGASPATEFELGRHINVSVKMLALDTNLAKVHSRLISRIPESTFWHRYFSRVEALRSEMGFEPLCEGLREVRSLRREQSPHGMLPGQFGHFAALGEYAFVCVLCDTYPAICPASRLRVVVYSSLCGIPLARSNGVIRKVQAPGCMLLYTLLSLFKNM